MINNMTSSRNNKAGDTSFGGAYMDISSANPNVSICHGQSSVGISLYMNRRMRWQKSKDARFNRGLDASDMHSVSS